MTRPFRKVGSVLPLTVAAIALATGCPLDVGALKQASRRDTRQADVPEIEAPAGFRVVRVAEGLSFPSSIVWDERGRAYVLESHTVPVPLQRPKVLRLTPAGLEEVPWSGPEAPTGGQAVGLAYHDGRLYVSHEEKDGTWGITRFPPEGGRAEAVVRGIPTRGDHWINYLAFDSEGALWFGAGSATNSGVVSSHDPVNLKWIHERPDAHDIPCRDVELVGASFEDVNDLSPDRNSRAATGVFQAYGSFSARRIPGQPLCTGALYRVPAGAKTPEMVAWGFRNPVALAFAPDGTLLIGMHGADVRGTRPVRDDPDAVYRLRRGAWYGWPDFASDLRPVSDDRYRPAAKLPGAATAALAFVLDHEKSGLAAPDRSLLVAATEPHAALGGMTVVPPGGPFAAWAGSLLLSEMGDFKPTTDAASAGVRAGFQIERVDLATGARAVFARNRGGAHAEPASHRKLENGFERPVDVKFGPDGLLYVVDFGVFNPTASSAKVLPKTGKVFRIEPAGR